MEATVVPGTRRTGQRGHVEGLEGMTGQADSRTVQAQGGQWILGGLNAVWPHRDALALSTKPRSLGALEWASSAQAAPQATLGAAHPPWHRVCVRQNCWPSQCLYLALFLLFLKLRMSFILPLPRKSRPKMAEPMAVALPYITRVDTQTHGEAPGPGNPAPALAPPAPASSVALDGYASGSVVPTLLLISTPRPGTGAGGWPPTPADLVPCSQRAALEGSQGPALKG